MTESGELVTGVIALNGGQIAGKTRLQKTFYLLEACGLESGFDYEYHHYGPYSFELTQATDDAVVAGLIEVEERFGHHQVPYTIFSSKEKRPSEIGSLDGDVVVKLLSIMDIYSALELELAATIHYLREIGYGDEAIEEIKIRKPMKADETRLKRAQSALNELRI